MGKNFFQDVRYLRLLSQIQGTSPPGPSSVLPGLLPCPFCGSSPHSAWVGSDAPGMEDCGYWAVECPNCNGNEGNAFVGVHAYCGEVAERVWNNRIKLAGTR